MIDTDPHPMGDTEPFSAPVETDVLVIGGGIMGVCMALYLSDAGVGVAVVERGAVNGKASGRNAGSLHAQLQSAQARRDEPEWVRALNSVVTFNQIAIGEWVTLASTLDTDVELTQDGGMMMAETEDELRFLEAKVRRERGLGLDNAVVTRPDLDRLAPYASERIIGATFCPLEGRLNPIRATPAIARGARRAGARIFQRCEVLSIEPTTTGFKAQTSRGTVRCAKVVNAAGPWADRIAAMVGVRMPMQGMHISCVVSERQPRFIPHLVYHASRRLTMKQVTSGNVIVGGGWPAEPKVGWDLLTIDQSSVRGGLTTALRVVPALAHVRFMRSWAGTNVHLDGQPLLGAVPGVPNFYLCVSATGYSLGPACARLVTEVVAGRDPSFDIAPFSVERFSARADTVRASA